MPTPTEQLAAQDPVLRFLHDSLELDHLHYGLFTEDDRELTFAALRRAQDRYADRLLELIGELGVRDVLDVGCGFGTTARRLAGKGHQVALLSPDPYQLARIEENGSFAGRHVTRFEDFVPDRRWDLVLMSESGQYVDLGRLFTVAAASLRDPGYLLMADYFTKNPRDERRHPIEKSGHPIGELRQRAREAGFELRLDQDITAEVLPTLELAVRLIDRHAAPVLRDLELDFGAKCERRRTPSRWLRSQLKYRPLRAAVRWAGRKIQSDYRPRIDPVAFRELKEYRILLFARESAP